MTIEKAKEMQIVLNAFFEGKKIQYFSKLDNTWLDIKHGDIEEEGFDETYQYRIKPEPKKRIMTLGEILYFVTTNKGLIVRTDSSCQGVPAQALSYNGTLDIYEWASVDRKGNPVDGWHKFEVEE